MFSLFPDLLYPYVAPLVLRVGLAVAFGAVGYLEWKRRAAISHVDMPLLGQNAWWVWVSILVHVGVAVALFFGLYTQGAAMLGALLSLKHAIFCSRYTLLFPLGRAAGLLMLLICLSLMLSGPGILGQDLPL